MSVMSDVWRRTIDIYHKDGKDAAAEYLIDLGFEKESAYNNVEAVVKTLDNIHKGKPNEPKRKK